MIRGFRLITKTLHRINILCYIRQPSRIIRASSHGTKILGPVRKLSKLTFDRVKYGCTTVSVYHIVVVIDIEPITERFSAVAPFLDERGRGLVAAAEAFAAGYGGIAAVAMATGIAPSTIGRGLKELAWDEPSQRIRLAGRRTQTDDFQRPHAAPRSQGAGRADDTR